jgi:hypothetical protein
LLSDITSNHQPLSEHIPNDVIDQNIFLRVRLCLLLNFPEERAERNLVITPFIQEIEGDLLNLRYQDAPSTAARQVYGCRWFHRLIAKPVSTEP